MIGSDSSQFVVDLLFVVSWTQMQTWTNVDLGEAGFIGRRRQMMVGWRTGRWASW